MTVLDTSMHPSELPASPVWTVRMIAVWREELLPMDLSGRSSTGLRDGLRLRIDFDRSVAQFSIRADSLSVATRVAIGKFAHAIEAEGLPAWDLVSMEVHEVNVPSEDELRHETWPDAAAGDEHDGNLAKVLAFRTAR